MGTDIAILLGGLVVIGLAADQAVLGAARLADRYRLPRVVLGALLIGVGTSLPEGVVSVLAALSGQPELAFGNIVGSNAANLGLVLGVAAVAASAPLVVDSGVLSREVPLALGASLLVGLLVLAGMPWPFGVLLLVAGALVTRIVLGGRRSGEPEPGDVELAGEVAEFARETSVRADVARAVLGLVATLVAAEAVLTGAGGLAEAFGWDAGFIGLAIVAVGTSLPELVTALTAVRRHEDELVLGNVLGSNLANSLLVAGVATLAGAAGTAPTRAVTEGVLLMAVLVVLAAGALGRRLAVSRAEGAVLLAVYVGGLAWIAL